MQKENEDVIKLRKASKLATVQGIRTVTEIMKKLIHDPWIQQECTRMAWNFIFHYPKFKKIFYDYEGIETTIESIALHYKNKLYGKHIAKSGLFCIHQMATIITTKNPKMKTTLIQNIHETTVRSNVVEVAVNAMRYYPLDARLQEAGCAALGWWAFKATNRDRAKCIIAGGLEVCEEAQASHTKNVHVQRYANWTIELLREAEAEYKAELIAIEEAKRRREMIDKMVKSQIEYARQKKLKKDKALREMGILDGDGEGEINYYPK